MLIANQFIVTSMIKIYTLHPTISKQIAATLMGIEMLRVTPKTSTAT